MRLTLTGESARKAACRHILAAPEGVARVRAAVECLSPGQRQVVALGRAEGNVSHALSLARQWAMLSYRTPEEFARRFDAPAALESGQVRTAAEDYLAHCGRRYAARWCSTAFLRLSESIDLHRVDASRIFVPVELA